MTDAIVHTPDYLIDMLENEAQTGSTDLFKSDDSERLPPMRRIEFPQQNSRKHGGQAGKIFISGLTADQEGEYVDYIDLLLVDPLVLGRDDAVDWMQKDSNIMKHMPYGGRTMWEFDDQGKRVSSSEAPVCSSNNGLEPWKQYRDKEYFDYRTKETHRIGWQKNPETGELNHMPNACVGCPFAQDVVVNVGVDAEGKPVTKWYSSMCRESYTYVVWDVDRKELMTLKAVNLGMQFALTGRRNKAGRRYDGEEFKGIRHYFSHAGQFYTDPTTGKRFPTFGNRPQGKPSIDNPNAPVHPVRMTVTLNNFEPNTYVPNFTVLNGGVKMILGVNAKKGSVDGTVMIDGGTRTMTPEEYVAYLKDQQMFIQDDMKNRMMAMYLVTRTDIESTFDRQLPAGTANPQLPDTASAGTTADYDNPF